MSYADGIFNALMLKQLKSHKQAKALQHRSKAKRGTGPASFQRYQMVLPYPGARVRTQGKLVQVPVELAPVLLCDR